MVWDLRGALLKKQEVESARLDDFEFALRARTMKLLGADLDRAAQGALIGGIALRSDSAILDSVPAADRAALRRRYDVCRTEARRQLIAERGDPAPHRLA